MRRVGLALAAAGVLVFLAAAWVSPSPTSAYELGQEIGSGALDARRVRLSAHAGAVHSYDATNDTTYFFTSVCNHSLCGPLVPIGGDHRGALLEGPLLLRPVEAELRLVPVPAAREAGQPTFALGAREETQAFSSAFDPASAWPPFLARIGAVALAAAGAGIAARRRWRAALPALGALASLMVAQHASWIILVQLVGGPTFLISGIVALAQAGIQRRGWVAAGIALGAAVAIACGFIALRYFPGDGGS